MVINNKFKVGQRVFVAYKYQGEVSVYDDYIAEISIDNNGITYWLEHSAIDKVESELIDYNNTDELITKIKRLLKELEEEGEESYES